jgi:hypothetical protein
MSISLILVATIVLEKALTETGKVSIPQCQASSTSSSSSSLSLTPEQKAAICDPNNPESNLNPVNTTESKICAIPVTKSHSSNASLSLSSYSIIKL